MKEILRNMDDFKIIEMYRDVLVEMKSRNLIRSSNLIGDWGERLAINFYNESPQLPNLEAVRVGTKNVDAISREFERYSIKTTTTKMTGVFNGLNDVNSEQPQKQKFEYVIIVMLNKDLSLKAIYELDWENFLTLKKWNKSKKTWYLSISNELKRKSKVLYDNESNLTI
ncbi:hypothetical protein H9655_08265 [Cytobacillus sp. Sa5YUA1]|uniref:Uncharacterized protein n=1 Tax=Cytobacillus stercorigallinarum TaxID=2762240 RepID=A0ABR8QNA3_9BACI|nr:hypothetical protein [Cytobacillus stercorigallinarum]MBD7937023.1 hypothetical protein [Cytobacillus stercorigallinarum]